MKHLLNFLKTAVGAGILFLLIISVLWLVIFSSPFLMDKYVGHLSRHAGPGAEFRYEIYTKSEFAERYFNRTIVPEDDFIALFEEHVGSSGKTESIMIVMYDFETEDPCIHDIYGINKYRDLVYKTERRVCGFKR